MMNSGGKDPSLDWRSLIDLLEARAKLNPDLRLFTFLQDGEVEQGVVTAATLASQARSIAAWLERLGLGGKRILLIFPQSLEFIAAFFGCVYAGAISVPAPMPDPSRVARTLPRLQGILADAAPAAVLTNRDGVGMAAEVAAHLPELTKNLQWIAFEDCPWELETQWHRPAIEPHTPTHLQYTSGSTSTPKGTIITHANVLANVRELRDAMQYSPDARSVVWEPYFHDDGLIQGLIQPIFTGYPCFLMAPAAFVARPVRWLQAMSRYRATHTTGPNFAYELCIRKISDEERDKLDLSSCIGLQNAAEPVRAETLRRFHERFAPCGLRWIALAPNYGLAEATLCVAVSPRAIGPVIKSFDSTILEREGRVCLVAEDHPQARLLPSSGVPAAETQVVIADPQTLAPRPDGHVGEILVKSAGVAAGYLDRPEESQRTFQARLDNGDGPYLRTGDQGFMLEGNLFVTGRIKDLIIIRGENRYPQDIELSVERSHPAIAPGNIAAFSVEVGPEERLVVVAEIKRGTSAPHGEVFDAIRDAIAHEHELRAWAVALLAPGTLPKTSSGKIQRLASRKAFTEGTLQEIARWTEEVRVGPIADERQAPAGGKSEVEIQAWLTHYLTVEFGARAEEIGLEIPFTRFGLDSASAVRLAAALGDWIGTRLDPVIAWNYPNILTLSRHLQGRDDLQTVVQPQHHAHEPIAIIGAACRFPGGATSLETFWRLLDDGIDAIGEVPATRWIIDSFFDPDPDAEGKMVSRSGGFLADIDRFEPAFFEISPREAAEMDPQQRLLLEVSWEAFENAGQTIADLRGSNTGVYVGISGNEYQQLGMAAAGTLNPYLFLGTAHSTGVARLSYWLGLQGPNLPVNTACSSSLVAVHLASRALRNGECFMAIAGGVNLLLAPESSVCLSRMRALSPTGRCHTFSADADGYVRSEGCGMVVLKRLSDAERDGDSILAVIRGTAVNQDGRSNGLTAPNGPAQEDVIRRALSDAGVLPHEVDYVEAHGTGTPLGDPIEVQALAHVLGEARSPEQPVGIGSVKTNIGHAESAAGIAGLLKVILAFSHEHLPPSLHFRDPSPHVPWSKLPVRVVSERVSWGLSEKRRIAGVSSFGMSGTNAHVILEEPPRREEKPSVNAPLYLVPFSAKTPDALTALAKSYASWLSTTNAQLHDIAYTASLRRSHFAQRLSVTIASKEELATVLDAFATGQVPAGLVMGKAPIHPPKVVFVFSGQGSQWLGMGRQLYRDEPTFRDVISACDAALRKEIGCSIIDELHKPENTSRLAKTLVAQPALFAIGVALARLLQSWGVVPSALIGHSVGEIAAAHISGMLDLDQAARLVSLRARIMQKATGLGKMVSVSLTEEEARQTIAGLKHRLGIGAINDPDSVVLSGDTEAVDKLVAELSSRGVAVRPLRVDYAFHSPQMESLAAEFLSALGKLDSKPATIPLISTVTGKPVAANEVDAAYWARNIRQTVRFSEAVSAAVSNDRPLFVEVGPHPVLAISIERTLAAKDIEIGVVPTLRREKDERKQVLTTVGALHAHGYAIDGKQFYPDGGRVVQLPTYRWQRERYWIDSDARPNSNTGSPKATIDDADLYRVEWREQSLRASKAMLSGTWILLGQESPLMRDFAKRLGTSGGLVVTTNVTNLATTLAEVHERGNALAGIVYWAVDVAVEPSNAFVPDQAVHATSAMLQLVQALVRTGMSTRLHVVTRNAVAVCPGETIELSQSPLWGFGRVVMHEHPELGCKLVDIDVAAERGVESLWNELHADDDETNVVWRGEKRLVARLTKVTLPAGIAVSDARPRDTVLITGGLGALGLHAARWLCERYGVAQIILVGRHAPSAEKLSEIERMRSAGVNVTIANIDVSDAQAVRSLIQSLSPDQPLRGIIHAAGVLDDGSIAKQTPERLAGVFGPKVRGAWNLYEATRDEPPDFFVMFSSAAGILGNAGQSAYSAANTFLDALASRIRASGGHALSLAWGPWDGQGMAAALGDSDRARLRRAGVIPMSATSAMALLDVALRMPDAVLVPIRFDFEPRVSPGTTVSPILRELVLSGSRTTLLPDSPASTSMLALVPETQRFAHTLAVIRQSASAVLGLPGAEAVPSDKSLFELGLDSLMATELRNRIVKSLGVRIGVNAIMQTSTPRDLVAVLLGMIGASAADSPAPSVSSIPSSVRRSALYPLSAGQTRLYFLDHALEHRETYNIQIAIRIDTALNPKRLQVAIEALVDLHDQMRMHIVEGAEGPMQRILPWVDVPVEVVDLRDRGENGFTQLIRDRAAVPFDLMNAPLLRVTLAHITDEATGLLIVWHHIATDGWSVGLFLRQLDAIYSNPDTHLLPGPSYPELIAARKLDDASRDQHRRWWATYLEGVEPLALPTDHAPIRRDRRGGMVSFRCDAALSDGIDALARKIGVTPFVVLLAAWAFIMHRYCRQERLAIAVISNGRTVRGAEDAIGLFIETLPVLCAMDDTQSVTSNIAALRQSLLDALDHEHLSLDEILAVLPKLRRDDIGDTPLLRVSFVLEHASWFPATFNGAKVVQVGEAVSGDVEGTHKFDLGLAMVRDEAGYRASIEYAADLFESDTIDRLAGHLRQALTAMVASPENRLSELDMLTAVERRQMLVEWNDTATNYPAHKSIHELFEEQVRRAPNTVAVIFGDTQITYAELDARADRLAHALRSFHVGPDVLVGICMERSIEMIIGLLGILKAGGAYVPLDPKYPKERLTFMLNDASVPIVLTENQYVQMLSQHHARVLTLDSFTEERHVPPISSSSRVQPENLAYVMYTSGSTGNPKGVCVTHRNVVRLVLNTNYVDISPSDRIAQASNSSFDAATFEIWGALLNGAAVVIVTKEIALSLGAFAAALEAHAVSILFTTTALFNMVVRQSPTMFHSLRYVLFGGEAVDPAPVRTALARGPAHLLHVYGPTETTTFATFYPVHDVPEGAATVPIGKPIANTTAYVLDAQRQIVPIGVPGELYIGGDGVARGYFNRPDLTAERFVQDIFSQQPDARLYKTGDLCRLLADGHIEFLGRLDNQVKIRGFRIELGEIEAALASHASVRSCVVIVREDRPGDKRLVAYVEPNGTECATSDLRMYLVSRLPEYMIPSAFVFLYAMPLTPNGKIDRKALPTPEFDRAALSVRFVAARTRIEETLARLWADVLGLEAIGIHDNFFELGGNSLLSIRLISRAANAGLLLTVGQLFESPTIAGLAKQLATNKAVTARCLVPLRPSGSEIPLVLTPGLAGTSMVFLPLRDALRTTMPVWSFDDPHLARHSEQPETIEELVRLWVAELLATMPDTTTFRLGGYSFGGMVAVEMARQLTALGKAVDGVIILDGGLPNNTMTFDPLAFAESFAKQLGAPTTGRAGTTHHDIEEVLGRIAMALGTRQESAVDDPLAWARAALVAAENNHRRMMQWQVRPVDARFVVLHAGQDTTHPPDLGWSTVARHPVQAVFVPGDHQTMMEAPFVQTLAFCIEGVLAQYDGHAKRRS